MFSVEEIDSGERKEKKKETKGRWKFRVYYRGCGISGWSNDWARY